MQASCNLGKDAKLYFNTGTTATPVWTEVGNVRGLTLGGEKALADVTTRDSNGFRQQCATLKDMTLDFVMNYRNADTNLALVRGSFYGDTTIEMLVLTGDIASADPIEDGLQATWGVNTFTENQELEEAINYSVSCVIAPGTTPAQVTTPIP